MKKQLDAWLEWARYAEHGDPADPARTLRFWMKDAAISCEIIETEDCRDPKVWDHVNRLKEDCDILHYRFEY